MKVESKWLCEQVERRAGMMRGLLGEGRWRALRAKEIVEIEDKTGEIVALRVTDFGGGACVWWADDDRIEWERARSQRVANDRMIEKLGAWTFRRYARNPHDDIGWGRAELGMWHERTVRIGVG